MKLIHLSDLHIGKRVNDFSMIEDQKYILDEIIKIIDDELPQGVLIAGDVYDKSTPSEEAVRVFDAFLSKLAARDLEVFIISGNHDSAAKLSFASSLIDKSGVHISPEYNGIINKYVLTGNDTTVNIYMLPFIKPAVVKNVFSDEADGIGNYSDAVSACLQHSDIHTRADSTRGVNILVAHQFVTGASRSESEDISVGGLDNVDASVFEGFDYVALGHIHGPQNIGSEVIRYCGTPLKYSFSEANHNKSVTVIDIDKEDVNVRTVPLTPIRDMRVIKGSFEELTLKKNYENTSREDYIQVILTDEEDVIDAMAKLRVIYPNVMKLTYDSRRSARVDASSQISEVESKSPKELFAQLYEMQNNKAMSSRQEQIVDRMIERIWDKA